MDLSEELTSVELLEGSPEVASVVRVLPDRARSNGLLWER